MSQDSVGFDAVIPESSHLGRRDQYGGKKLMKAVGFIAIIGSVAGLSSCASNSGVLPIGEDTYMVSRQAASGFSGMGTLKAEAFAEAKAFCDNQNKHLQVVKTQEAQPPYIAGNFPKAEVQFMCLSEDDPELMRPKLRRDAGVSLEVKKDITPKEKDLYTELKKLKELLDEGIITQEEFDTEKKELLSQ